MNTIMANSFELKGTNYEMGVQLGRTVLNNSHLRDIFISKSQSIQVDECDIYELFDRYCPGLNEELQGFYDDFFGTIKSIVFDLNLSKVDICWCGLYENEENMG
ncbi:MAG TPA: hypothetical protein DCM73_11205 [Clostridiales bacterium]|nr:hypothetical protein [Clostridiales bacterium]